VGEPAAYTAPYPKTPHSTSDELQLCRIYLKGNRPTQRLLGIPEVSKLTQQETQRLAKVEQKVDDLKDSTNKGFGDLNIKLDAAINKMDNLNESFVTVAQAKVAIWITGFLVSVGTLVVLIYNALHGNK
jgi:hypothetical protein